MIVVVAALEGLYGRRYVRHSARKVVSAWMIAFVTTLVLMLVVDPVDIGARYVVAWLVGACFALAGRYLYDALVALAYGPEGDAPPALLLGSLDSCLSALPTLAALAPSSRVRVVGLVVPDGESQWERRHRPGTSDHGRPRAPQGSALDERGDSGHHRGSCSHERSAAKRHGRVP